MIPNWLKHFTNWPATWTMPIERVRDLPLSEYEKRIAELESQLAAERNRSEHEPCPVCGHALLWTGERYECDECAAKFDGVTTAITIHKDIKSQLATVTAERDALAAENGMFKMGFHEAKQQEEKP